MTKKEKEKALKEVDRQLEEKKTVAVPEELWEKILHLSELMEVDKQARTDRDYDREAVHAQIWAKHGEIRSRLLPHLWLTGKVEKLTPETKEEDEKYTGPGPFEEKTFIITNSDLTVLEDFAYTAEDLENAVYTLKQILADIDKRFKQWGEAQIPDKEYAYRMTGFINELKVQHRVKDDVDGFIKIFDAIQNIRKGKPARPESNMPDDMIEGDELPF